jgi:hypothetical protein
MNIEQLESFNLSDAVKFHDKLNPLLWDNRENLHPEIKGQLLAIAADFGDYIGVDNLNLKDITISGSNAAFSYTPHSDIDLHLIVDLGDEEHKDIFRELFDAKKFIYNTEHKITIKGIPVELYVQDANQAHHSQGVYSILNNAWIEIPRRRHADIDDMSVRSKYKDLSKRIREAIKSKSVEQMNAVMEKIRDIRGAGLASHGEFGAENLAFKLLRNKGDLKKLQNARKAAKSAELSLKERIRPPVNYGYGQDYLDEVGLTPDGTNPSTCEFTNEDNKTDSDIVNDFAQFCVTNLRLESPIRLRLKKDPTWSERNKTFGRYNHETNELEVSLAGRHLMDVLRTIAHELTHQRQHEREDVPDHAGETGSEYENEANARAGILMREYGHQHPELFTGADLKEATGYIPTAAEADDPRFEMALTVDIKPGAIGKNANKLLLNTDSQGHPQELRPDGMVNRMMNEWQDFKLSESGFTRSQGTDEITGNSFVSQGCTIKFNPDALLIYKGSDLLLKKDGDYSHPTKKDLHNAKVLITRMVPKLQKGLRPNLELKNQLHSINQEIYKNSQEYDDFMANYKKKSDATYLSGNINNFRSYTYSPKFKAIQAKDKKLRAKYNELSKSGSEWI